MTSPKHAKSTAKGRTYTNPQTGEQYPSVTTILGQIGKAEALKWWAAGEVARYAVEKQDIWRELDQQAAIDLLKREPLRSLSRAADRGTDVHAIADHYMQTGETGTITEHNGYVEALLNFVHDHQPLPLLCEKTVYGEGYAGSFDMVCKLPALGDQITILDYKTSKAIYPDTAAQLAAYAIAGRYIDENDQFQLMPIIETGAIVRLAADGTYEIQQADLGAGAQLFRAALAVFQAQQNTLLTGQIQPTTVDLRLIRENIAQRVTTLRDQHRPQFDLLAQNWIANLPPLTGDKPITRHQLAILDSRVQKAENTTEAPFDPPPALETPTPAAAPPPPPRVKTDDDDLEVAPEEIDVIRNVLNAASDEVRAAIKATTEEASKARATLSLQTKPTLRRARIARAMLEIYTEDCTEDRAYMRAILVHIGIIKNATTTIGAALGRSTHDDIARLEATVEAIRNNQLQMVFENNTYTIKKAG